MPLTLHLFQALVELIDTLLDQAPVGLELGFARAAQADAALLPFQMGPAAHKARGQVDELGEFHLQLSFEGCGALGKNVEDETGAIQCATFHQLFDIALLSRRQGVIEDHHLRLELFHLNADFLGLAAADEILGIGCLAGTGNQRNGLRPRGPDEFLKFLDILPGIACIEIHMHQDGSLTSAGTLKKMHVTSIISRLLLQAFPGPEEVSSGKVTFSGLEGTTVEMACLYTIWLTLFLSRTANWSKDSTCPCNLIPLTR